MIDRIRTLFLTVNQRTSLEEYVGYQKEIINNIPFNVAHMLKV